MCIILCVACNDSSAFPPNAAIGTSRNRTVVSQVEHSNKTDLQQLLQLCAVALSAYELCRSYGCACVCYCVPALFAIFIYFCLRGIYYCCRERKMPVFILLNFNKPAFVPLSSPQWNWNFGLNELFFIKNKFPVGNLFFLRLCFCCMLHCFHSCCGYCLLLREFLQLCAVKWILKVAKTDIWKREWNFFESVCLQTQLMSRLSGWRECIW